MSSQLDSVGPPTPKKDDDPDTYLAEASVAEVRAFEKRTRQNVETRKKELRSMVGEQYVDLIAAADTIIDMEKKAKVIQQNLQRMQESCDVHSIQREATHIHISEEKEQSSQDQKRQQLYILAALIKSLADVPEQIWHALEGHQYLQAGCLYILAREVHKYLETEDSFMVDIDIAFPVIQRQWDAVSFFKPQIIQRSIQYLRVVVLESEDVANVLIGLMQIDGMTRKSTLETLLEMRTNAINDLIQQSIMEKSDFSDQKLSRHLRDIALIIQRTLIHIRNIYLPAKTSSSSNKSLLTIYAEQMQSNFTIPNTKSSSNVDINSKSNLSHRRSVSVSGSSSLASLAVTRLFSPSTNAHLLIRYLPESIQHFTAATNFGMDDTLTLDTVSEITRQWTLNIKQQLDTHLEAILQPIISTRKLLDIRNRLWDLLLDDEYGSGRSSWMEVCQDLLGEHYSIYGTMFRSSFNNQARRIVDIGCQAIADQPNNTIWPLISDYLQGHATKKGFQLAPKIWPGTNGISENHQDTVFNLPNLSSANAIMSFKRALTKASTERTTLQVEMLETYDKAWSQLLIDVSSHTTHGNQDDHFYSQTDSSAIKEYFQKQCEGSNMQYIAGLHELIEKLNKAPEQNTAIELSIWVGRVARLISEESEELPRALAFSPSNTNDDHKENDIFALKSGIDKDPKLSQLQTQFFATYREAYQGWIQETCRQFGSRLALALNSTTWNDRCPAVSVWENMSSANGNEKEDIVLPTMATNATQRVIFGVCEAIQKIHSTRLDKMVLQTLCHELHKTLIHELNIFIAKDDGHITEKGALQLLFDTSFLDRVLQDQTNSVSPLSFMSALKEKIDPINWAVFEPYYDGNVERFYLKQTLLLGLLVRPNSATFEKTRKALTGNQAGQQQYNVLPLAPQAQRFTLLPIGHGIRTR
ncbi:hypothetical protein BCR42DRAFT_449125 [Absidia repens]|uniref:Conserved oligomeric Golgi complex subunit 1 n=1 Tax=Absidia repens TaxID=90262 RepID=A0A1X2IMX3_9FUNG|nr:hypothetical protein BCR42DRAFT_449125 [Absidia repens]